MDREAEARRIVDFLRNFYLTIQSEELRDSFAALEPELIRFLASRPADITPAAQWIDQLFPRDVASGATVNLVIDVNTTPELVKMLFAMLANKASLGSENKNLGGFIPVQNDQVDRTRAEAMRELMRVSFSRPIRALEIGTWFGAGSTRIWLSQLPAGSTLMLLDAWRSYVTAEDKAIGTSTSYRLMDLMPQAALAATTREIFRHEAAGDEKVEVIMIRGRSSSVLDLLKDETFDFIYVDGSHYYDDVKTDLMQAKLLARRDFAIVCGDDLETLDPALVGAARDHARRDFVVIDGVGFHPGVARAVSEEFGRVNLANGFWWIHRRNGVWAL